MRRSVLVVPSVSSSCTRSPSLHRRRASAEAPPAPSPPASSPSTWQASSSTPGAEPGAPSGAQPCSWRQPKEGICSRSKRHRQCGQAGRGVILCVHAAHQIEHTALCKTGRFVSLEDTAGCTWLLHLAAAPGCCTLVLHLGAGARYTR
jgi:hypothetical protein